IEAEAAMLGQPVSMLIPEVIGFKLTGKLREGITATDLVLTVTQMLRQKGVVGKFVEFYGDGLASLPLADRATIANMAPEYGATCGFFPVDDITIDYLHKTSEQEIQYRPARVLMQDFTGVPAVVDLAAMRAAMQKAGGDPEKINPLSPVDLVIDHSVMVDFFATEQAFSENVEIEMQRNGERYQFLRWGQSAFDNFRVVPPGTGICHQVNLEYLAQTVWTNNDDGFEYAFPDTLVAEAAMLGQPVSMLIPEVIGFKLTGKLREGITATDLVLTVTQMLRQKGVVGKFVEFYGDGLASLPLADRATIANMAPEYGATCGFFPVDDITIDYLRLTGRD
ncbi:hypothetical protein GWI33_011145, partial [Rhynchophorus ferrugineus]